MKFTTMKTMKILKRIYYAITSGLFFVMMKLIGSILISLIDDRFDISKNYLTIETIIFAIIALVFIWMLTIQSNKRERYIYIIIILFTLLWAIVDYNIHIHYALNDYCCNYSYYPINDLIPCFTVMIMVAGFLTETKYYNIFPNQSKTISVIFRALSWIVQILAWAFLVLLLTSIEPYQYYRLF